MLALRSLRCAGPSRPALLVQRAPLAAGLVARAPLARRPAVAVRAAAEEDKKKKAPKKKIPSPVKRVMLGQARRMYNKSRKSACATRVKKVIALALKLTGSATAVATAEDVKAVEALVSEAYEEIDKAVVKGVLHKNNAAHKKSRVAKYKRLVAMSAGQFAPPADHPDHGKYQRMMERRKAAAAQ